MVKAERKLYSLGEICLKITDGAHNSPKSIENGLPMASVKDLTSFGINLNSCRLIPEDDFLKLIKQGCKPEKGDVLIAKDGNSALDTVCEIKEDINVVLLSSVAILRPNPSLVLSSFLFYYLDSTATRSYLKTTFITGAAIPRVILKDFKQVEISLPPLPTQQRIASILSNYDDLIENNTRSIQILEEQAQSLYRHWFVDYKFPGHENVKMVDSGTEFGIIPEGWDVKSLGELVLNFDNKRKPLSSKVRQGFQGVYPYYGAAKIIDYVDGYLFDGKYLLFAEDGSVITKDGKPILQYVNEKFWVSNHAHILQGKLVSTDFLYIALSNIDIAPFITGVAQPKINQANLNQINLLIAQKTILDSFDLFVGNIIEDIFVLKKQNINLKKQRDLLLPRLMSGEILVDDVLCN